MFPFKTIFFVSRFFNYMILLILWRCEYCKKKKNLFLFYLYFKTIHTYTLSMSYINNQNNTNVKIIANMVIMHIINNYNLGSEDSSKTRLVAIEEPPFDCINVFIKSVLICLQWN